MSRRLVAGLTAAVALAVPAGASAFGPNPNESNPAVDNCIAAYERQAARETIAGGGPKAGELGPLNCDHYFQGVTQTIGNGWPPPPFQA